MWLLIEWPAGAKTPSKHWLSDLPEATPRRTLVRWAKSRWPIEMNYREMKEHVGLDHFEGRSWSGWHHHVTMAMLAFGFVLLERLRQANRGPQGRAFPRSWSGSSTCCSPGAVSATAAASGPRTD